MESNSNRKVSIGIIGHITLDKTDLISTIESAIYNNSKKIRKNHVTIGTIGSFNHGKTILTAAILKVLYDINKKSVNSKSLEKTFEEIKKETTINLSHLEYETNYRHYTLIDCPGQEDYIRKIIAGMSQMNGAIFVIDGTQGINAETRKYFLLSRQISISKLVVFINKCDKIHDKKEIDLLELEIRKLLNEYDFDGNNTPIIRGSALLALKENPEYIKNIIKLIETVDTWIDTNVREEEEIFLQETFPSLKKEKIIDTKKH